MSSSNNSENRFSMFNIVFGHNIRGDFGKFGISKLRYDKEIRAFIKANPIFVCGIAEAADELRHTRDGSGWGEFSFFMVVIRIWKHFAQNATELQCRRNFTSGIEVCRRPFGLIRVCTLKQGRIQGLTRVTDHPSVLKRQSVKMLDRGACCNSEEISAFGAWKSGI